MNVHGILSSKIDKDEYEIQTLTSSSPDRRKASLFNRLKSGNPHVPVCKRRPKKILYLLEIEGRPTSPSPGKPLTKLLRITLYRILTV